MADLAALAAEIVTRRTGLAAATDALRTAHGGGLTTGTYLVAVRTALADAKAAAELGLCADLSNLPELADIVVTCYPNSLGKAVRELRDADMDSRGWMLPLGDYIRAIRDARQRLQAA